MKNNLRNFISVAFAFILFVSLVAGFQCCSSDTGGFIKAKEFSGDNEIVLTTAQPVQTEVAPETFTVYEENDPDIQMHPTKVEKGVDSKNNPTLTLTFADPLNQANPHVVKAPELVPGTGPINLEVARSILAVLVSIFIANLLINNYVFTKYLGLCVFMGTSKRKKTATGMGIVFTIVMLVSAVMSWLVNTYILQPFHLDFLQVVVFIGLVSLTVQAVDTILRKVNPILFNSFGVFLVLVIANCIIIAVPLEMANYHYNLIETIMLALGAGGGFLLALYLMSNVRERLELAPIPESFRGLPIAFVMAGQFALAFLGFSGLQIL